MPTEELSRQSTQRAEDQSVLADIDVCTDLVVGQTDVAAEMRTLDYSLRALPTLMMVHSPGADHCSARVDTLQIDPGIEPIGAL